MQEAEVHARWRSARSKLAVPERSLQAAGLQMLMKPNASLTKQPNVGRAGHTMRLNGKQVNLCLGQC